MNRPPISLVVAMAAAAMHGTHNAQVITAPLDAALPALPSLLPRAHHRQPMISPFNQRQKRKARRQRGGR